MVCRFSEFRDKEVINVRTGTRLGFVCDMQLQVPEGRVTALIVPGRAKFLGLFGREDDYIIPWECITRIGDDLVLIGSDNGIRRGKKSKSSWL